MRQPTPTRPQRRSLRRTLTTPAGVAASRDEDVTVLTKTNTSGGVGSFHEASSMVLFPEPGPGEHDTMIYC